jgi:hypothetical protein
MFLEIDSLSKPSHFPPDSTIKAENAMKQGPNFPSRMATASDGVDGNVIHEGRVEPRISSRKRNRRGGGNGDGGEEDAEQKRNLLEVAPCEGPHHISSEGRKNSIDETKNASTLRKAAVVEGLRSASNQSETSILRLPVRATNAKKEEEAAERRKVGSTSRIGGDNDIQGRIDTVSVGNPEDDEETTPSESEDKAALLYTDNIMAAAAATNELASGAIPVASHEAGDEDSGRQISSGRNELSALSASGLLSAATSQMLINQLMFQNAELHQRNLSLQQELESIKQLVAMVLAQLMAQQQPPLQQASTSNPELDFLKKFYPGLVGGVESRNLNLDTIQGAGLGHDDQGSHGDVASVFAQYQQQNAASAQNSLLSMYMSQAAQPSQEERHQQQHQQQQLVFLHNLHERLMGSPVTRSCETASVYRSGQQNPGLDTASNLQRMLSSIAATSESASEITSERIRMVQPSDDKEEAERTVTDGRAPRNEGNGNDSNDG